MKEKTIVLVDLVGNEKYFENMRTDEENIEVFGTFVDFSFSNFFVIICTLYIHKLTLYKHVHIIDVYPFPTKSLLYPLAS